MADAALGCDFVCAAIQRFRLLPLGYGFHGDNDAPSCNPEESVSGGSNDFELALSEWTVETREQTGEQ